MLPGVAGDETCTASPRQEAPPPPIFPDWEGVAVAVAPPGERGTLEAASTAWALPVVPCFSEARLAASTAEAVAAAPCCRFVWPPHIAPPSTSDWDACCLRRSSFWEKGRAYSALSSGDGGLAKLALRMESEADAFWAAEEEEEEEDLGLVLLSRLRMAILRPLLSPPVVVAAVVVVVVVAVGAAVADGDGV